MYTIQGERVENWGWRAGLVSAWLIAFLVGCTRPLPYKARGQVRHRYPHPGHPFTQGLVFDDGTLIESTGLYGESTLRRVDLETGEVLRLRRLSPEYFAEGCTVWNDEVIQLTWKAGTGFVYDKHSFAIEHQFAYTGEGWGLTHDGQRLIMSDGTSHLRFLDPDTFQETGRIQVVDKGEPVRWLNELEWIRQQVWANIWQTSHIARIDPDTGVVLGWIDLSELAASETGGVMNGIAVRGQSVFVTGKHWEGIYEVEVVPTDRAGAWSDRTSGLLSRRSANEISGLTHAGFVPRTSE